MKTILATIAFLILFNGSPVQAQTFPFSVAEFRDLFAKQTVRDNGDGIRSCTTKKASVVCTFHDRDFQKSVRAFKDMNLVNGRFDLKEKLELEVSDGKVSRILMHGDRSTPMGLFHVIGQVGALMRTLHPDLSNEDVTASLRELNLMRGDSDPTIGQPMVVDEPWASIHCLQQHSQRSTTISCAFVPRR